MATITRACFDGFACLTKLAADVDRNGMVDSKDATAILSYYSYKATGGKDDIVTFLDSQKETAAK